MLNFTELMTADVFVSSCICLFAVNAPLTNMNDYLLNNINKD